MRHRLRIELLPLLLLLTERLDLRGEFFAEGQRSVFEKQIERQPQLHELHQVVVDPLAEHGCIRGLRDHQRVVVGNSLRLLGNVFRCRVAVCLPGHGQVTPLVVVLDQHFQQLIVALATKFVEAIEQKHEIQQGVLRLLGIQR